MPFIVGIWIVRHVTSEILKNNLCDSESHVYESTREMIRNNLSGSGEDDIAMDSMRISLICPVCKRASVDGASPARNRFSSREQP